MAFNSVSESAKDGVRLVASHTLPMGWRKSLTIEWLGQMAASLFWIASVLTYGVTSNGDWLQLLAATSWFAANIASSTGPCGRGSNTSSS